MINRNIDNELRKWKNSKIRRPLLIRGARQVGKSFSVKRFGETEFENCVTVNFEEKPEFAACFETFDIKDILERISILAAADIKPGKTLLFLDEIQDCPRAISALRYFFEKRPELHVIAAGSLLEFVFRQPGFKMPVGRISSLFMYPLTFGEFLDGTGQSRLRQYLSTVDWDHPVTSPMTEQLENYLRKYLIVGGMPEVVSLYASGITTEEMKSLQVMVLQNYQLDFAKYAAVVKHKYLKDVFNSVPRLAGQQCKYSHINPDVQSRELKEAITLLSEAKCIHPVYRTAGQGLPLESQKNLKRFKLLFMDIGLMQRSLGIDSQLMFDRDILAIHRGGITEQFIGQQLLAASEPFEEGRLYFWARDSRNSKAEVDYLLTRGNDIIPVEVKSGKTGRLKSMRLFLDEHPESPFGIRFSLHELSRRKDILSIPLYLAEHWQRFAA